MTPHDCQEPPIHEHASTNAPAHRFWWCAPFAPLLPVAMGLILGIAADNAWTLPFWTGLLGVAVGAWLLLSAGRRQASDPPQKGGACQASGAPSPTSVHEARSRCSAGPLWPAPDATSSRTSPSATGGRRYDDPDSEVVAQDARSPHPAEDGRRISVGFVAVLIAAAGLGSLRHALADRWLSAQHVVFCTGQEPILATLQGAVLTTPTIVEPGAGAARAFSMSPKTRFVMSARSIAGRDGPIQVDGKVTVSIKEPITSLKIGDVIELTGWLYRPAGPSNPGAYDWAQHRRRDGLLVGLSCDHAAGVTRLRHSQAGLLNRILEAVRARLRGYLLDPAFPNDDPGAGVLAAMVLGERSAVPRAMNEAFIRTGNAHFLAASGMHVGWLAIVVWAVLRLLGVYYRTVAVVVGAVILAYVLLAEPRPSILRAGIMGLLWCTAVFLRGSPNVLNWLACSAVVILLIDPTDCFRPAFQFSFMAVLALVYWCPRLTQSIARLLPRTYRTEIAWPLAEKTHYLNVMDRAGRPAARHQPFFKRGIVWAAQLFTLALTAWLLTTPPACYHFNQFTPWGAFGTFALWFVAAPVTCLGFITLLCGTIFPSSGLVLGPLLKLGSDVMIGLVSLLARIPGTILDGRSPSLAWVLACYAVLLLWLRPPRWLRRDQPVGVTFTGWRGWLWARRRHSFKILALALVVWWATPPRWTRAEPGSLLAWFASVGEGSGTLLELPDGKAQVFDFGTRSPFDAAAIGRDLLQYRGIDALEAAYVSHPNFDHYSGIEGLLDDCRIRRLVINEQYERFAQPKSGAAYFLKATAEAGVPITNTQQGEQTVTAQGVTIRTLWPPPAERWTAADSNNASTVLRVEYQGRSILLTGDITEIAIANLLTEPDTLRSDVLVLPHHGGVVANTAAFIEAVDPQVLIRSAGQRQALTTSGLDALVGGRRLLNTADVGCILVRIRDGLLQAEPAIARGDRADVP